MILNGSTIKKLMQNDVLIKEGNYNNVHSSSYDLTVNDYILKFKNESSKISLIDVQKIDNMYEKVDISNGYEFKPGDCLVVVLEDEFNMPDDVCGSIRGRTSFNRLGLFITNQHINPGFKGKLNITISNHSPNTYILMPKMQIAQVVFEKMNEAVSDDLLYGNEKNSSYQNEDGLKGSKIYNDYIGKVVRHFKGNYYYIENICLDSETKEYVVVYRSLYNHNELNTWVRSADMFFEEIDPGKKGNITHQQHRFEVVNDLAIDYTK
ncbi:MAG: dCTP deaminase [Bacilli bacterium]|nr:dCTP deaminase [Bacilli bacterium]